MEEILNFLIGYIFLILIWGLINLLLFSGSYVLRKNLSNLSLTLTYIINFIVGIYTFGYWIYICWLILKANFLLFLFLFIFFGFLYLNFLYFLNNLLLLPFNFISAFFYTKIEELKSKPKEEYEVEYISPEGKIIDKLESEELINKKLAKYFLLVYFLNLLSIFFSNSSINYSFSDYILMPFYWLILPSFIIGIVLILINRIKHGSFLYKGIKNLLINTFRIESFLYITLYIFYLITGIWKI